MSNVNYAPVAVMGWGAQPLPTVLIMAGGLGSRLRPITEDRPKPMVEIGGQPILERIIERFAHQGFRDILISVNYRAVDIIHHFGDGAHWGVGIRYVEESEAAGTAGALRLLPPDTIFPLIVMNGDLMAEVDFKHMLATHRQYDAAATMACRDYSTTVPYGVVNKHAGKIASIDEKPEIKYLVNAGVYILSRRAMRFVGGALDRLDMTDVFRALANHTEEWAATYELGCDWRDIGTPRDLAAAQETATNGRL